MRTPVETLTLFKQVIKQRRSYVRKQLKEQSLHKKRPGRSSHLYGEASRGGMLSELGTITTILKLLEKGDNEPLLWWIEDTQEEYGNTNN